MTMITPSYLGETIEYSSFLFTPLLSFSLLLQFLAFYLVIVLEILVIFNFSRFY